MFGILYGKLLLKKAGNVFLILLMFTLLYGCATNKENKINSIAQTHESMDQPDSLTLVWKEYHRNLSDSICGKGKYGSQNIITLILANGDFYDCLRRHNRIRFNTIMKDLLKMYEFKDTYYGGLLYFWDDVHDEEFFEIALELLKEDYVPEVSEVGDFVFLPVYEAIHLRLVLPNIKSVDGVPLRKYAAGREDCFEFWLDSNIREDNNLYCYDLIKSLWDEGRIELYSEEHFLKKK